ncbi:MAG: hypothetical protein JWQ74_1766 [Marmoricola sp.]|nr:hypothetical protein [Marmoricola sp.]
MNRPPLRRTTSALAVLLALACITAACNGSTHSTSRSTGSKSRSSSVAFADRRLFSADSPWNTRIDSARVDPRSDVMMELAHERIGVLERPGNLAPVIERRVVNAGLYINTEAWTTPIVTSGSITKLVCRQTDCGDAIPDNELAVPAGTDPDPRYDGWFTIIDQDQKYAYDLWRARRESNNTISYQFVKRWAIDGPGFSAPQVVGARGSGLPLFAGLIRHAELVAGRIDHALAISVPGPAQRNFVQPASSTDGNGRSTSLPEGARIRLKDNVTLRPGRDPLTGQLIHLSDAQKRAADAIVAALRMYGAIVVDRASVPTLYAQRGALTDRLVGNELQGLTLDDFEVVTLSPLLQYPALTGTAGAGTSGATAATGESAG